MPTKVQLEGELLSLRIKIDKLENKVEDLQLENDRQSEYISELENKEVSVKGLSFYDLRELTNYVQEIDSKTAVAVYVNGPEPLQLPDQINHFLESIR